VSSIAFRLDLTFVDEPVVSFETLPLDSAGTVGSVSLPPSSMAKFSSNVDSTVVRNFNVAKVLAVLEAGNTPTSSRRSVQDFGLLRALGNVRP